MFDYIYYELKYLKEEHTIFVSLEILSVMLLLVFGSVVAFTISNEKILLFSFHVFSFPSSLGYFLVFNCNK